MTKDGTTEAKRTERRMDPKDISVMFGAPMTEEEFAEYRKKNKFTLIRGGDIGGAPDGAGNGARESHK
jgi:hypothetical protein